MPRTLLFVLIYGLVLPASVRAAEKNGAEVYATACAACHASGAMGAPKFGDASVWKKRIATGLTSLVRSALTGKGAMPAKAGRDDLSDIEVARAVVHMANAGGGKFKESAVSGALK